MKIFISHSWNNKRAAHELRKFLKDTIRAEVWLDVEQLEIGDQIQASIDKALNEMDYVIVLWSEHAACSDGVQAEIRTCQRLRKKVIPCLLDKTPFEDVPALADTKAVDFNDEKIGRTRLCAFLVRTVAADPDIDLQEEMKSFRNVEAVLETEDDGLRRGLSEKDKDFWIQEMKEALVHVKTTEEDVRGRTQEACEFIQQIQNKLGVAGNDRSKLEGILLEVIRNEHIMPGTMKQVRAVVEGCLKKLPSDASISSTPPVQSNRRAKDFSSQLNGATRDGWRQIRDKLKSYVDENLLDEVTDQVFHYISTARQALEDLARFTDETSSQSGMLVVQYLFDYLEDPNDLLPESRHGIWGFLDDAWLIHNTAYRLVESNLIPASQFSVHWDKIATADRIVIACLPDEMLEELEDYLMELLGMISFEVSAYRPEFVHMSQDYHPFMGDASAVGGGDEFDGTMSELVDAQLGSGISFDFGG